MDRRIVTLDALRALAALLVAVAHFFVFYNLTPTFFQAVSVVSVEVFFVISGFVLAPQILLCVGSRSRQDLLTFYGRRWMRTIPPYAIAVLVMAVLSSRLYSGEFWNYLSFTNNLVFIDDTRDFFPVAWSLSIEEWFYLIFPAFLLLLAWLGVDVLRATLLFVAIFFLVKIGGMLFDSAWATESRRVVMYRLDAIAFGFALYVLLAKIQIDARVQLITIVSLLVSAAFLYLVLFFVYSDLSASSVLLYLYTAILFGAAAVAGCYVAQNAFDNLPRMRVIATSLSAISYDIYLFHLPVLLLISQFKAPTPVLFIVYVLGVGALSVVIRTTIERKILALRPRFRTARDVNFSSDAASSDAASSPLRTMASRALTVDGAGHHRQPSGRTRAF